MKRLWFALFTLPLGTLIIALAWLLLTEGGLNWLYQTLREEAPITLEAERIEGRLIGPLRISQLWLENADFSVQADTLELEVTILELLFLHIHIEKLYIDGLEIELPPATDGPPPDPAGWRIQLPLRQLTIDDLKVQDINLQQGSQRLDIDSLELIAREQGGHLQIDHLALASQGSRIEIRGDLTPGPALPMDLDLEWALALPEMPRLVGQGRLFGDLQRLELEQSLSAPGPASLRAVVDSPLSELNWNAQLRIKDFDARQWGLNQTDLRGETRFNAQGSRHTARARGKASFSEHRSGLMDAEFDIEWSDAQRLEVRDLRLASRLVDSSLGMRGWWLPGNDGGRFDARLEWRNLRWPLQADAALLSPVGHGQLEGSIDDYRFQVHSSSPLAGLPDALADARGSGNLDGVQLDEVVATLPAGRIVGKGRLDWTPQLSWRGELTGSNIDPAALQPDWPGRLDFASTLEAALENGEWRAEARIQMLQGTLRQHPVAVTGSAQLQQQAVTLNEVQLRSGESRIELSGRVNERLELVWKVRSPDLRELHPELQGQLRAAGSITGSRQKPLLNASLEGTRLTWRDYKMETVKGELAVDIDDPRRLRTRIQGQALNLAGTELDALRIEGDYRALEIETRNKALSLKLAIKGDLHEDTWKGSLQRADIEASGFGGWQMQQSAALVMKKDLRLSLGEACWQNTHQARICARVDGGGDRWHSQTSLSAFPVSALQRWLPPGMHFDSTVTASLDAQLQGAELYGRAEALISPGTIRYPLRGDEEESIEHAGGVVRIDASKSGIRLETRFDLGDGDGLSGHADLASARLLSLDIDRQPLRGEFKGRLHKLGFLAEQLPEISRFKGRADLDFKLSGKLRQPDLDGSLTFNGGQLAIPRLGLEISEIDLKASADALDRVRYQLSALSGEGRLRITGEALQNASGGWMSELSINGENVEVSRIPEARIVASPALKIIIRPLHIDISGRIDIPYAIIEPRDFTTATRASSDVVIVGREEQAQPAWRITSRVLMVLGERVHFSGFGLEGRLTGQVQVEESPGLPTRANGEIAIADGRYRAYGQRLTIDQGRLLYSGGPLTSPGVDARAIRRVGEVTAGVRARGQLQQPVVELFSTPAMGQTEVLSYLLLGRPLDKASESDGAMMAKAALALGLAGGDRLARSLRDRFGLEEMRLESSDSGDQASLVVGRYLSPRLYVSYGVGLIEAFNTLMVRYNISERWQLKAESGEAHGADLIYTIER